jgi:hypothetical protein
LDFVPWPSDRIERAVWEAGCASTYVGERPDPWLPRPEEADAAAHAWLDGRKAVVAGR